MGRKSLILWVIVALGLLAGYLWLARERQPEPVQRQAWLPELQADAVAQLQSIELKVAGEPRVRLARQEGAWVVPAKEGYAADAGTVAELLRALREAEQVEPRTANPALHARLGLAEEGAPGERATRLKLGLGESSLELRIGNPAARGEGQLVRRAGDDQVWLINRTLALPGAELAWLDRRVTLIPFASVRELDVHYAGGERLTLYRDSAEQPNLQVRQLPAGRALRFEAAANGMATLFSSLQFTDALPLAQLPFDGEAPALRFSLATFDGGQLQGQVYVHADEYWLSLPGREGLTAEQVPGREGWAFRIEAQQYQALAQRLRQLLAGD